jgi:hypothetical protein
MSNCADTILGGKSLKVKCKTCEKTFHIKFDFRRHQRIDVNLPGKLLSLPWRRKVADITVISLSVSGIGFTMQNHEKLAIGSIYDLNFCLDDDNNSTICEEIVIRRMAGLFVGAEFYHNDRYNYDLDFYIASELWGI